ncbi:hypothetical protein RYX36_015864 [Vicia faba]
MLTKNFISADEYIWWPAKMMEDFLRLASANTRNNLETSGVLAGSLEFHLETLATTHQNIDSASKASSEVSLKEKSLKIHLFEPKPPLLQTTLRARPPTMKSSLEIEQEELEKIHKLKARHLK